MRKSNEQTRPCIKIIAYTQMFHNPKKKFQNYEKIFTSMLIVLYKCYCVWSNKCR